MDTDRLAKIRRQVHRQWAALAKKKERVTLRPEDQMEHLIDAWHEDDDSTQQLWEYVGMTWGQYSRWVNGQGLPEGWVPPVYEIKKTAEGNPVTATGLHDHITTYDPRPAEGVDKDGMIDLSHLRLDYDHLQELKRKRRLLDEAIKVYEDKFKEPVEAVTGAKGFKVDGLPRYRYEANGTFPHAKFAKENPHVAEVYQKTVKKFDVETFKKHQPLVYQQWLPRRFVEISETKKG